VEVEVVEVEEEVEAEVEVGEEGSIPGKRVLRWSKELTRETTMSS